MSDASLFHINMDNHYFTTTIENGNLVNHDLVKEDGTLFYAHYSDMSLHHDTTMNTYDQ